MASVEECEEAFRGLAAKLAGDEAARKKAAFDRSVTCSLRDLRVIFAGQLRDGQLLNIRQVEEANGQVRMTMTSDDLLRLVAGELSMGSAWATRRIKIDANIFDLLRLRSIF